MADAKITDLAELTTVDPDADFVEIVDMSEGGLKNKKVKTKNLKTLEQIPVACSDESTALTTGAAKVTWHMAYAFHVVEVFAGLSTVQTGSGGGGLVTIDINEAGASILSTKITIDNGEETSLTAATQPVISDAALAKGAKMTADIDQIGDGTAKGLKIYLIGYRT
jgi:hypothetical protein